MQRESAKNSAISWLRQTTFHSNTITVLINTNYPFLSLSVVIKNVMYIIKIFYFAAMQS